LYWKAIIWGETSVPTALESVVAIAAGTDHILALVEGDDVKNMLIPERKVNFSVHSPDYEFDTLE